MSSIRSLFVFFKEWLSYLMSFLSLFFKSSKDIKLENIALRSQLAHYQQRFEKQRLPKPTPTPAFRQLWVILSKYLVTWKSHLIMLNLIQSEDGIERLSKYIGRANQAN